MNLIEGEQHRDRYIEARRRFEEMHLDCLLSVILIDDDETRFSEEQRHRYEQINEQRHQFDRDIADLRPIQAKSLLLNRSIEESQSTRIFSFIFMP
jgi:hypothetical protein